MRANIYPIYWREIRALFFSPVAYIVTFVFLIIAGYFWTAMVDQYSSFSMSVMQRGGKQPMLLMDYLINPFLGNLTITLLFIMPFVSMRFFSEEKKQGTIETLFTFPFSDVDILLGKFFAGLTLLAVMIGLIGLYPPLFLAGKAAIYWPPVLSAYVGLFLVGSLFLALGTFASSLTENQVVSAALTFGVSLLLFVISWITQGKSGMWVDALNNIGIMGHFQEIAAGVIHVKDLTYFVFFISFLLFSTLRVLESKKWR